MDASQHQIRTPEEAGKQLPIIHLRDTGIVVTVRLGV